MPVSQGYQDIDIAGCSFIAPRDTPEDRDRRKSSAETERLRFHDIG
jgi:hypothetical protein